MLVLSNTIADHRTSHIAHAEIKNASERCRFWYDIYSVIHIHCDYVICARAAPVPVTIHTSRLCANTFSMGYFWGNRALLHAHISHAFARHALACRNWAGIPNVKLAALQFKNASTIIFAACAVARLCTLFEWKSSHFDMRECASLCVQFHYIHRASVRAGE